jgi:glycine amidinotransferase
MTSAAAAAVSATEDGSVASYNEWDPLEEVIVGEMGGASVPFWDVALDATVPEESREMFLRNAGRPFPAEHVAKASEELNNFAGALARMGITVQRPLPFQSRPFATPTWQSPGGLYSAMPRDILLVIGNTIIESPMAWRCRYFEIEAYRPLLMQYFNRGSNWVSAPKPQLLDSLYNPDYDPLKPFASNSYVTTEAEPVFDAADFIRCGRDIFAQRSHVTNRAGIEWVARHIGPGFNVHVLEVTDSAPMHIDASFMPLAPGKLLLNRERVDQLPKMFDSWDVRYAPEPTIPKEHTMYLSSGWVSMNVLMLDPTRVVVEAGEYPLMDLLSKWGFEIIPVPFRNVMRFGGCFHCVTADVRRRGRLQSYFNSR